MDHRAKTCLQAYVNSEGPDHTQSDQGIHSLLTESLDYTECMNWEQNPGWYFAHAQDNLNLFILHMLEGTFWLDVAQMISHFV